MFLLPRHHFHQFSNTHGSRSARLPHYNYFPLLLSASPDPDAFITTNRGEMAEPLKEVDLEALYAEPALKTINSEDVSWKRRGSVWVGSFFPDMSAWDKLTETRNRGAGGRSVAMEFPGSEISCHMSMFPPRTYKKAHRHGPGRAIVIPAGEGYSVMWEEGKDKVVAPWRPGSLITPPNKWFHQHFNTGPTPARYLAFKHEVALIRNAQGVPTAWISRRVGGDQIDYADERPEIRAIFAQELAKHGMQPRMEDTYKAELPDLPPKAVQREAAE